MKFYLGIDVGGTQIKYAVVNDNGDVTFNSKVNTPKDSLEEFLDKIYEIIDGIISKEDIKSIGFSIPGKVDSESGIIYFGGSLPYLNNLNLKNIIEEKYNCETCIENDGKAAALGEKSFGNLEDIDNGAIIVLGTGVGSGIILNGKLFKGEHFQSGEISFAFNEENPLKLTSFYGYKASSVYLIKRLAQGIGIDNLDGEAIFSKIYDHQEAMKIVRNYSRDIAALIFNMQVILDLKRYLIGGGISAQEVIIKTINEEFDNIRSTSPIINETLTRPEIVPSKFRDKANLIGAVACFLNK